MTRVPISLALLDAFMAAPKRLVGTDKSPEYGPGFNRGELELKLPIEMAGELPGAFLSIVGRPAKQGLWFRIQILFGGALARVDYTDEFHPNGRRVHNDGVPYSVYGPHYHSWPVNQRFFKNGAKIVELHNALPLGEV